ncbi:hypothetical protein [Okeania sp. SIO1I7]|nr:hypothetical protein [Okeania sp. SIO1I7]
MAEKYLCKLIFAFLLLINEGRRKREEGRRVEIEKKKEKPIEMTI